MKYVYLLVSFFLLTSAVQAQKYSFQQLKGRWLSEEGGGLEVIDSSHIYIVYQNEKKPITSFKSDFSRTPAWLDFDIADSGQVLHMKSLLQFMNADLIKWQVFDEGSRPANFTIGRGEVVFLRRKN